MLTERIVVIGGTGFIGSPLVESLVSAGHRVTVIGRQARPVPAGASFVIGEVADRSRMFEVVEGAAAVYHLGTGGGSTWAEFERDFVQGARNVAEACLNAGVRRLVYTSSIAALYLGGRRRITDEMPADQKPQLRSLYSRGKIAAEAELLRLHEERRLPVVILRPGVVVGRRGILDHGGVGQWPTDIRCIGWGSGRNPLPLVLVDDVVDALVLALSASEIDGRALNVVGDVCISAREYVDLCSRESLRDYRFYPRSLPYLQSIEIIKWVLKVFARKAENPFPSYRDLKSRSFRASFDNTGAKRALGWTPNADLNVFVQQALRTHIRPVPAGDLRRALPAH
jgi:nucleoside-diphosphate-sugar epimerase